MKKYFKFLAVLSAAVLSFAACNEEPQPTPDFEGETHTIKFVAGAPETKTTVENQGGAAVYSWEDSDLTRIHVFEDGVEGTVNVEGSDVEADYILLSVTFPGPADQSHKYTANLNGEVKNEQCSTDTYDADSDVLVAYPVTTAAGEDAPVTFNFKRVSAISKVTLKGLTPGDVITEVSITSASGLVGEYTPNEDPAEDGTWALKVGQDNKIVVTCEETVNEDGQAVVWFVSRPLDNASITVTAIATTEMSYTKTTAPKLSAAAGNVTTFGCVLNLADGAYAFTAVTDGQGYIMKAYASGNNIKSATYEITDGKIVVDEKVDANECIYTITRVTEGAMAGYYTICDVNSKYIYAAGANSNNYLKSDDLGQEGKFYWSITSAGIVANMDGRNTLRFNDTAGQWLFSCYESGKQSAVSLVPASKVYVDETPKFKLSGNTLNVDSDGTLKDEITVTPNRYCGDISFNVSYTDGEGWISDVAIVDGKLSMTVNANEGTERVATVTLSATGAESQSVTVTQAAYVPGGDTVEGTIKFGSATGSLSINAASVSGDDSNGKTWTVKTEGTSSYTPQSDYAQIGSSSSPATSITFTATIPSGKEVTAFEAKFGGFSGTAGSVKLYVDDVEIGSGSLNGTSEVTISATESKVPASGQNLKVTVTGISKGVKAYSISYAYEEDNKTPQSLSFDAATGTWDMYTNTGNLPTLDASGAHTTIEYSSSDETVATVNASTGAITAKKTGTATITATAPGDATYKKATATYELTVTDLTPIISIKKATENISSDAGTNLTIADAYALTNVADAGITVTYTGNITAASISNGTVTYTISENDDTSNPKDSKIFLTVTSAKISGEITITQAKKGGKTEDNETITLANGSGSGSGTTYTITWGGTSCTINQAKGSSNTSVSSSYISAPRWYQSHVISFAAKSGYSITSVVVKCTTNAYATALKNSTYSTGASAEVSNNTVTITTSGDFTVTMGAQSRISSILVNYEY